jgi:hypothetical protein
MMEIEVSNLKSYSYCCFNPLFLPSLHYVNFHVCHSPGDATLETNIHPNNPEQYASPLRKRTQSWKLNNTDLNKYFVYKCMF